MDDENQHQHQEPQITIPPEITTPSESHEGELMDTETSLIIDVVTTINNNQQTPLLTPHSTPPPS